MGCQFPARVTTRGCFVPPPLPAVPHPWKATKATDGTVTLKLDGPYELILDERKSSVVMRNTATGWWQEIWGDPHHRGPDGHQFDTWGTSTTLLDDGTKITVNTTPWKGNTAMTLAENIVITKENKSAVINGLSQNDLGDLVIETGMNGRALDRKVWDGHLILREGVDRTDGKQVIINEQGNRAVQADGNRTKAPPPPESPPISFAEQKALMDRTGSARRHGRYDKFGPPQRALLQSTLQALIHNFREINLEFRRLGVSQLKIERRADW
ncbi:MAG: DUF1521 domain-containing protein [Burkholderiales bacterium]|nr:DUF1521 domain-containing protein [Burkholderiales bacterium]